MPSTGFQNTTREREIKPLNCLMLGYLLDKLQRNFILIHHKQLKTYYHIDEEEMITTGKPKDVTARFLLKQLRKEVKKQFNYKCKDYNPLCPKCVAWQSLENLELLLDDYD